MLNSTKSSVRDYLIKQLPTATAFINTRFEVVHASDQWIDSFEFSAPEVFGATIFELFGETGERWRPILESCFKGTCSKQNIDSYFNDSGEEVHIQWRNLPWYDENENIVGAIIQNQDVTQRIVNEQKLVKLGAFLDEKSKTAKIGSWELDINRNIWWCSMTKEILGVPESYIPSQESILSFFKEGESQQKMIKVTKLALEKGKPWSDKFQIITKNGEEKWVICTGNPLYQNGETTGLIGTFRDITEKVNQDAKSKEKEHLLQTLIDHLPINVFIKDTKARKILANKHELEFFGLQHENQILGKDDSHFITGESLKACLADDFYVIEKGKAILKKENTVVLNNGKEVTFSTSKIPLLDEDKNVIGLVGISLDISDQKVKEEELRRLINVTSLQNKKLVDFAHIISHNLRSHAANFSMLLEFLVTEKDKDEKQNITQMLVKASDGLLESLDNLNGVVAISTNINIDKKQINLSKSINKTANQLSDLLLKNNVTFINNVTESVVVKAIPEYLENILNNFITNGVKYRESTRDSFVKFKTTKEENYTVLSIEDNGIGIDLKKHGDKMFGMYKTFHHNEDAKGIGLFFTKKQIEAMNGKVEVYSEVGVGTTFKIYFNDKS
ncbi:PAS domain-containing protein [Aurantibacter crassamenti]|nr:PAS domain-containing protein [Aurantibacter crassamenti]